MSLELKQRVARLNGQISADDAENLLEWIQQHPKGKLDLSECRHLHTACLQVLMVTGQKISAWPADNSLAAWLHNTLPDA